jgi:putative N-acetylmannosamine-6-phosphate epimerase
MEVITQIRSEKIPLIAQDDYHEPKTAQFIAEKSGAKAVVLSHDAGNGSLDKWFDSLVAQTCPR